MRHSHGYGHGVVMLSCYNGKGCVVRWHGHATMPRGGRAIFLDRHVCNLQGNAFVAVLWLLCLNVFGEWKLSQEGSISSYTT